MIGTRGTLSAGLALILSPALLLAQDIAADKDINNQLREERLNFQTFALWSPRTNMNGDVALVYGVGSPLPSRMDSWRDHNYRIQGMTGVAWGEYQSYLDGQFDGQFHWDEAQKYKDGSMALHGDMPRITPYISPGDSYGHYLSKSIQQVLDAGAEAITLEEPEYYADTGWSENFKRQWKAYYAEDWRAPDSSPDAQYRASELKYDLYRRTLGDVFASVKRYGDQHGRSIPCYVGTHSLINYAHWTVVSPESSLIGVGADGFIAQIWTGTARTPNVYEGRRQERSFATAFLEYGAIEDMIRTTGRKVWFLNDPVEDDPNHDWNDYRGNWESTLTASLLHPEVWRFEIAPWPDRIFDGKHLLKPLAGVQSTFKSTEKAGIPSAYATELQTVFSALGDMKQPEVRWEHVGTQGVGVLISDSMMFQRADPNPSDENLGSFYGLALPLLQHGIPVEPAQIENTSSPGFLDRFKLLILTYEGQKPPSGQFHEALAKWVRAGGALVVVDDDRDPYNSVREWWNTPPYAYRMPRLHLFEVLGISAEAEGITKAGKGVVAYYRQSPAALTYRKDGAEVLRVLVRQAAAAVQLPWSETNALVLRRGPYVVAAGLDESIAGTGSYVLQGRFINLFDPNLEILSSLRLTPGTHSLLVDLQSPSNGAQTHIVAAACRVRHVHMSGNELTFLADGIADTEAVIRVRTTRKPTSVEVEGKHSETNDYDADSGTLRIRFPNSASAVSVQVRFSK